MQVIFTGPPGHKVAIIGVGVVSPGDLIDAPEDIAKKLLRDGQAILPTKPEPKKIKTNNKTEEVA